MSEIKLTKEALQFTNYCTKEVDPLINQLLYSYLGKRFWEVTAHQIKTGGKRLRPVFLLLSCKLLGGDIKEALYPAAAIEITHNYTLIIDDIIDNSKFRRGNLTVWNKFGTSIAECIGVHYSASIFEGALHCNNPLRVCKIMAETIKIVLEGEVLDILQERSGREEQMFIKENRYTEISLVNYIEMVAKKTAKMFQSSCEIGAICANANEKEINKLNDYGLNLGISFQIKDDILDIFGEENKFGKKIGKDIEERKGGNIVVLYALSLLEKGDSRKLKNILIKKKITESDIRKAVSLIKKSKAQEKAEQLAENYINKAVKDLNYFPESSYKNILLEFTNYITKRDK